MTINKAQIKAEAKKLGGEMLRDLKRVLVWTFGSMIVAVGLIFALVAIAKISEKIF